MRGGACGGHLHQTASKNMAGLEKKNVYLRSCTTLDTPRILTCMRSGSVVVIPVVGVDGGGDSSGGGGVMVEVVVVVVVLLVLDGVGGRDGDDSGGSCNVLLLGEIVVVESAG